METSIQRYVADRLKDLKKQHKSLTSEFEDLIELRIYTEEEISPEVIAKLLGMFREEFLNGSPGVIKQYLSILVESITVTDEGYEAICHTAGLLAAITLKENLRTAEMAEVRKSSLKWCA